MNQEAIETHERRQPPAWEGFTILPALTVLRGQRPGSPAVAFVLSITAGVVAT